MNKLVFFEKKKQFHKPNPVLAEFFKVYCAYLILKDSIYLKVQKVCLQNKTKRKTKQDIKTKAVQLISLKVLYHNKESDLFCLNSTNFLKQNVW